MQRVLVKDRNLTTFVAGSFHATVGSLTRNRTPELDEGTVESTRERDTEGGGDQHAETRQRRKEKHRLQLRNGNKSTHRERALDDSRAQAHRRRSRHRRWQIQRRFSNRPRGATRSCSTSSSSSSRIFFPLVEQRDSSDLLQRFPTDST